MLAWLIRDPPYFLPLQTVLRIWDAFFNEGRKVLFRVALTLIKKGEVNLISCTAIHHVMTQFQAVTKDTYTWYSHNFMQVMVTMISS